MLSQLSYTPTRAELYLVLCNPPRFSSLIQQSGESIATLEVMSSQAMPVDPLTHEVFSPYVGDRFEASLEAGGAAIATLTLEDANAWGSASPDHRMPFSLIFKGPPDVHLEQQIYWLTHPAMGTVAIFLVPISGDAQMRRYQAVFN